MKTWRTKEGKEIPYNKLTNDQLKNIIKDGFRNDEIKREAKLRKIRIPKRAIDTSTTKEIAKYVEDFAVFALEGNKFAEIMMGFWRNDKPSFFFYLNMVMERKKEINKKG